MTEPHNIQTPAEIAPIVEVLGEDGAVDFLLEFGGAELTFSKNPREGSMVSQEVGQDRARLLGEHASHLPPRIPLAKRWLAKILDNRGLSQAQIARKLRVQDKTVRAYLKDKGYGLTPEERQPPLDDNQLSLF